jgi:alkanesulfonate monooxygenase SsuD/methylene tetrahydromethanopterin reductase-like flavin-dependent oxidoreductase (luciferase family)
VAPYVDRGYRGFPESALLVGSPAEVAEQVWALAQQGYTDVIVRNISADQREALVTIEHLAEVRARLG